MMSYDRCTIVIKCLLISHNYLIELSIAIYTTLLTKLRELIELYFYAFFCQFFQFFTFLYFLFSLRQLFVMSHEKMGCVLRLYIACWGPMRVAMISHADNVKRAHRWSLPVRSRFLASKQLLVFSSRHVSQPRRPRWPRCHRYFTLQLLVQACN